MSMPQNTDDTSPDFNAIISDLRRWYYSEIRSLADEAIKEINSEHDASDDEDTRREWLDTWLHETIDGHEFVIYTFKAKCSLLASDNEDAMENELGESGTAEQRCYFAMRADVMELIEARTDEWLPDEADPDDDDEDEDPDAVHLLPPRGDLTPCGKSTQADGGSDADINAVTCEPCKRAHEAE